MGFCFGRIKKATPKQAILDGLADPVDRKTYQRACDLAWSLDSRLSFMGVRFGISSLVGFAPVLGDMVDLGLALYFIHTCMKSSAVKMNTVALMYAIAFFDFVIGFPPLVGDMADVFFRANMINLKLFERALEKKAAADKRINNSKNHNNNITNNNLNLNHNNNNINNNNHNHNLLLPPPTPSSLESKRFGEKSPVLSPSSPYSRTRSWPASPVPSVLKRHDSGRASVASPASSIRQCHACSPTPSRPCSKHPYYPPRAHHR